MTVVKKTREEIMAVTNIQALIGRVEKAARAGLLAMLCVAIVLIGAVPAGAGNVNNWLTGSGLWSDKGSWSAGVVPNGSGYDAYITGIGGGITVQVDGGYDICNLTLGYGNTLAIQNGVWANLGYEGGLSSITNNGTIALDANGSSTKLILAGNVDLEGSGVLSLGANNRQIINYISGASSYYLKNGANHTIIGTGYVGELGMAIINDGTITASGGSLYIYAGWEAGKLTNNGILQAVDGATLYLSDGTFTNNNVIRATNGSTVALIEHATVTGGSLTSSDSTSKITGGNVTLNNVTLTEGSKYKQTDGTTTTLAGTITNNGTIILDSYSGAEALFLSGDVTLAGSGTINLGAGYHYNSNYISAGSANYTLTIGADQTIAGTGFIGNQTGFKIVNYGTISANNSGTALYIYSGAIPGKLTNYGTLQAVDGGILALSSGTFDNSNGVINATSGSTVALVEGATVTGGNLTSDDTSKITGTNVTLNNVTLTSGSTYKQVDGTGTTLAGTITNNGTIFLNAYSGSEKLAISGDVVLNGTGTISMGAGYHYNINYITGSSSNSLTIGENQTITGCGYIGEGGLTIVNNGTIIASDSNGAALNIHAGWTSGKLTNNGTLAAASGDTLYINGVLTNYDANTKTLTGGTYGAAGTIVLRSGYNITTNAATIVLSGTGSQILAGSNDALANLSVNASEGTFKIKNGRDFTTAGDFTNAGHVNVGSGSTLTIGKDGSATYTQTSGTTKVNGTLITNLIAIEGGSLTGTGTILGSLANYGTINPGNSPGTLNITGDYTQDATATLLIELAGTTQGTEYDWLNVSGTATLDGTLEVTLYGTFELSDLSKGDTFVILTADSILGTFASVTYDDMDDALWKIIYGDTTVTLEYIGSSGGTTPTPEPTTILLMVLGLAWLAGLKRRFHE